MLNQLKQFLYNEQIQDVKVEYQNGDYLTVNSKELRDVLPDLATTVAPVNFRNYPSLKGLIFETIQPNEQLLVLNNTKFNYDYYDWVMVKYHDKVGFVVTRYLQFENTNCVLLDVPYIRQEGIGATQFRNDCGCACVAMLLAYYTGNTPTVNELASETTLAQVDNGLYTKQLKTLAFNHGLNLDSFTGNMTIQFIKRWIDKKEPVLVLINYSYILGRLNQRDTSQHFVIVTGYDDNNIYVNDPDWYEPNINGGHNMQIPMIQFENSLRHASPSYQGLV